MTRVLERAHRSVVFVPECLTASHVSTDLLGLFQFTNRQILITRVYSAKTWAAAAATHILYCFTLLLGIWLTLSTALSTLPAFHLAILTFVPVLLAAIRAAVRVTVASEVLSEAREQITMQSASYILLAVVIPYFFLLNFLASVLTRKLRWRGVTYELISPQQTRILAY